MYIAHMPAGYLLTTRLQRWAPWRELPAMPLLWAGLIGSVFPDLDHFWFWTEKHPPQFHHQCWLHIPFFWIVLGTPLLLAAWWRGQRLLLAMLSLFLINVFGHLLLDSVVGGIYWLEPFGHHAYALAAVPDQGYRPYYLNDIYHWSFGLEMIICAFALRQLGKQPLSSLHRGEALPPGDC